MQGVGRVQQVDEVWRYRAPGNPILGAPGLRRIGLKTLESFWAWREAVHLECSETGSLGEKGENTGNHLGHCLALFGEWGAWLHSLLRSGSLTNVQRLLTTVLACCCGSGCPGCCCYSGVEQT